MRGRARPAAWWLRAAALVGCALVLGGILFRVAGRSSPGRGAPYGAAHGGNGHSDSGEHRGSASEPNADDGPQGASATAPSLSAMSGERELVVAGGLRSRRLYALPLGPLLERAERDPNAKSIPFASISEPVGSARQVVATPDSLIVASSNLRTLVKVPKLLVGKPTELALADVIGSGNRDLRQGMFLVASDRLLVAVGFGTRMAIVDVDPVSFTAKNHVIFDDRFGHPTICIPSSGRHVFMLTSGWLDVLDPTNLARLGSVRPNGSPGGLECVGTNAWVSDTNTGSGGIWASDLSSVGSFRWPGQGTLYLHFAPQRDTVYGTDPVEGTVFACSTSGGECRTSIRVGNKPTDLLAVGGRVLVTLESDGRLGVVDASDLRVAGSVSFPDMPRTLTLLKTASP